MIHGADKALNSADGLLRVDLAAKRGTIGTGMDRARGHVLRLVVKVSGFNHVQNPRKNCPDRR